MQMVAMSVVSHPSKTTKVPHLSETEAPTTTEVTLHTCIELSTTNDTYVIPPIEIKIVAPVKIEVTSLTSIEPSIHTNEGFP